MIKKANDFRFVLFFFCMRDTKHKVCLLVCFLFDFKQKKKQETPREEKKDILIFKLNLKKKSKPHVE